MPAEEAGVSPGEHRVENRKPDANGTKPLEKVRRARPDPRIGETFVRRGEDL
jgi:hypothetical protein